LERLDRFYIGSWASARGGTMTIWPGTVLSDHFLVSIRVQFQVPDAPRRGRRIPDSVFLSQSVRDQMTALWDPGGASVDVFVDPADLLETCISTSSEICRHQAQLDSKAVRQRERSLHARLASTHCLMQQHPQDMFLTEQEHVLKAELRSTGSHISQ